MRSRLAHDHPCHAVKHQELSGSHNQEGKSGKELRSRRFVVHWFLVFGLIPLAGNFLLVCFGERLGSSFCNGILELIRVARWQVG